MIKKFLMLIVVLAAIVAGLAIYAKQVPGSRVADMVNYAQRNLPGLFASGHLSEKDVIEFGKGALDHADKVEAKQSGKSIVYKWRDAEGNWTYGNAPPPGVKATQQEFDTSKINKIAQ